MFALLDASLAILGFILLQKDSYSRSSNLQTGSTSLKHALIRWNIPELEVLPLKYILNKCHYYTAWSKKPIIIYSDCSGLKDYQLRDISDIDNIRLFNMKADIKHYKYSKSMCLDRLTA